MRHFREDIAIDLHTSVLHAEKHWQERKIDLVINLGEVGFCHFLAQSGGKASGNVGGFWQCAGKLQVEAAQRDFGQAMARICRIEQIRIQHRILMNAFELEITLGEDMHRGLQVVDGLRDFRVGEQLLQTRADVVGVEFGAEGVT